MNICYRTLSLERASLDRQARTVNASFSSETPYGRDFGDEVLIHDPASIDMSRAANGLPLLYMHDRNSIIGRAENIRLENRRLVGTLRFSENPKANEVWRDVEAGILTDISVGYRVDDMSLDTNTQAWRVVRWLPLEVSVVSIPADATVGINRSQRLFTINRMS